MTDLVPYTPPAAQPTAWVELLAPAAELARQIADTEFVPAAMRRKPAAVAAAVLYGQEIGIGPMQALAKIHIVEGRPAPSAELGRALALAAGHDVWVEDQSNTKVTVCGRRRGSDVVQRVTWTMDDAKRAGLDGRANYRKFPRQMLLARASAELVRMVFPDVLGGIAAFAEELEDGGTVPGATPPSDPAAPAAPAGTVKRQAKGRTAPPAGPKAQTTTTPAPTAELPPLPGEDEPADPQPESEGEPLITDAQRRKLMATYRDIGVEDRKDQKHLSASLLGLDALGSHNDLTVDQASRLIDQLQQVVEGTQALVWGDDGPVALTPVSAEPAGEEGTLL